MEPEGTWPTEGRRKGDTEYRSGKRELHCVLFYLNQKMPIEESDVIITEVQATRWRLRQSIQVRELAAMHRLGQMGRLRMLEEQKWKPEAAFDRIDITAEIDTQRFIYDLSEPLYTKIYNPR